MLVFEGNHELLHKNVRFGCFPNQNSFTFLEQKTKMRFQMKFLFGGYFTTVTETTQADAANANRLFQHNNQQFFI